MLGNELTSLVAGAQRREEDEDGNVSTPYGVEKSNYKPEMVDLRSAFHNTGNDKAWRTCKLCLVCVDPPTSRFVQANGSLFFVGEVFGIVKVLLLPEMRIGNMTLGGMIL